MAQYSATLISNTSVLVCGITPQRDGDGWKALVHITGTFGGGTVTLGLSTDGGTTIVTQKDLSGNVYSATSNDSTMMGPLGYPEADSSLGLYATLTGATAPSITVQLFDNVG